MKEKQPKLSPMVRAYLNAEQLAQDHLREPEQRLKFKNSLDTLYQFMTPTERQFIRQIKEKDA